MNDDTGDIFDAPAHLLGGGYIVTFANTGNDDPAAPGTLDDNYLTLSTWSMNASDDNTPGRITKATCENKVALFKFGGLVGSTVTPGSGTAWNNNLIKYNPAPRGPLRVSIGRVSISPDILVSTGDFSSCKTNFGGNVGA